MGKRSRPYNPANNPTTAEVMASVIRNTHSGYDRTSAVERVKREIARSIERKAGEVEKE